MVFGCMRGHQAHTQSTPCTGGFKCIRGQQSHTDSTGCTGEEGHPRVSRHTPLTALCAQPAVAATWPSPGSVLGCPSRVAATAFDAGTDAPAAAAAAVAGTSSPKTCCWHLPAAALLQLAALLTPQMCHPKSPRGGSRSLTMAAAAFACQGSSCTRLSAR